MNRATEETVRSLLRTASAGGPEQVEFEIAPRRRRMLVPSLAALLTAGVVAVVTMMGAAGSAQAVVAQAAERTASESFRVKGTSDSEAKSMRATGYFDPAARTGRMVIEGTGRETRFLGDKVYQYDGTTWTVDTRIEGEQPVYKLSYTDPQAALEQLREASNVREVGPAQGEGWTGTRYSFEMDLSEVKRPASKMTGTVDIDEQGRVRHMDMQVGGSHNVADYFDFGAQEEVVAPADAQPVPEEKQGKRP